MSTLTSLFGMLPLMLMPGVGSEIYRGLAAVIVGGMTVSGIFTLVLFPSLLRMTQGNGNASSSAENSIESIVPITATEKLRVGSR
jgi:Cu/Ag efflux pump CusA